VRGLPSHESQVCSTVHLGHSPPRGKEIESRDLVGDIACDEDSLTRRRVQRMMSWRHYLLIAYAQFQHMIRKTCFDTSPREAKLFARRFCVLFGSGRSALALHQHQLHHPSSPRLGRMGHPLAKNAVSLLGTVKLEDSHRNLKHVVLSPVHVIIRCVEIFKNPCSVTPARRHQVSRTGAL